MSSAVTTPASRTAAGSADEVVDVELRVAAGFLLGEEFQNGANGQLGDGVPTNDVPFLSMFPYVALAASGLRAHASRPDGRRDDRLQRSGCPPRKRPRLEDRVRST